MGTLNNMENNNMREWVETHTHTHTQKKQHICNLISHAIITTMQFNTLINAIKTTN